MPSMLCISVTEKQILTPMVNAEVREPLEEKKTSIDKYKVPVLPPQISVLDSKNIQCIAVVQES